MLSLNLLASRAQTRDLRRAAAAVREDRGEIPLSHVTLRHGSAADRDRLRQLADLDSAEPLAEPVLLAEVDGRLRAAVALDGSGAIADPFHRGTELIELLRVRAAQLAQSAALGHGS
jgi:hypothetical protein